MHSDALKIGIIGAGNMAQAMARGWNRPLAATDSGSGRAAKLVAEVGGLAFTSNSELAIQSDVVFLCHKPAQTELVAQEIRDHVKTVVSLLGGISLEALRRSYTDHEVIRIMPNTPVELRQGVICVARDDSPSPRRTQVLALLNELGTVVEIDEAQFEAATALGGCAPAFYALFMQKLVESGVKRGLSHHDAKLIAGKTLTGSGMLIDSIGFNTAAAIKAVASPGGLTERALHRFDQLQLGETVDAAVAAVVGEDSV